MTSVLPATRDGGASRTRRQQHLTAAVHAGLATADWPALGTTAQLVLTDPGSLAPAQVIVERRLAEIDRAASRFRADSELSRLNGADGEWVEGLTAVRLGAEGRSPRRGVDRRFGRSDGGRCADRSRLRPYVRASAERGAATDTCECRGRPVGGRSRSTTSASGRGCPAASALILARPQRRWLRICVPPRSQEFFGAVHW